MRRKKRLERLFITVILCVLIVGIGVFTAYKMGVSCSELKLTVQKAVVSTFAGKGTDKNSGDDEKVGSRVTYEEGFYYEELSDEIKERITGKTFPEKFPEGYEKISYDSLRYVKVRYYDFDGKEHADGEMIVHKDIAEDVVEIFYELYVNKYQFQSIRLADDFDGIDEKSMEANNTSAFNYRLLETDDELTWHCFGLAIDVNPLYNPYVLGDKVLPENGEDYVDRSRDFLGKIDKIDLAYEVFTKHGFLWGGDFEDTPDYQHFYRDDIVDYSMRKKSH